jgi:hypothetical protein
MICVRDNRLARSGYPMFSRSTIVACVAIVAVMFAAAYVWAPFHALDSLGRAVRNGDRDALAASVDFPAVRENLRNGFVAHISKRAADDRALEKNPLIGLALSFVPTLVNSVVDAVVTPDGIIRLLSRPLGRAGGPVGAAKRKWNRSWHFVDVGHFAVEYYQADNPALVFGLVFERQGVLTWRLVELDLPEDEIMRRLDKVGGSDKRA